MAMNIKELKQFASDQNEIIFRNNLKGYDKDKRILHASVKLNEELGELCDLVLKKIGSQRFNKGSTDKESLGNEIADVFFTASVLAELLGVDIEDALERKSKIINNRYDKEGSEIE